MSKLNLKPVGEAIGKACKAVGYGLVIFAPRIIEAYVETHKGESCGYNDAVNAILESDMWASDIPEAISSLKRGKPASYYKAIVDVANSDSLWASDKLELIQELAK